MPDDLEPELVELPAVDDPADVDDGHALTVDNGDVEAWTELVGPFYDAATVATVLNVSVDGVRARARRRSMLALRTGSGQVVYPVWQLADHAVPPGLAKVLKVLTRDHAVSTWTIASWLRTPEPDLDGRTPLEVLLAGGEDDQVLLVASHAAAGWG